MFEITRSTLTLFGFTIRWYGVLIALGVLGAVLIAGAREKKLGLPRDTALNLTLWAVPLGIVCARLYYVAFSWADYAANPLEILNLRSGGLAIYGGVIGGVLTGLIYARAKRIRFASLADLAAPALALGQCVGRWGNFLNQEAYGRAVESASLRFFPLAVYIDGSGWHYATFFYESAWCALIVALILVAEKKGRLRRPGDGFLSYAFLYALERAQVEGLRTDSLYLGPLRVSQLLSLAALLALTLMLARRARRLTALVRALPVLLVFFMGAALALDLFGLSAVFGLCLAGLAAAVYLSGASGDKA